ncbi:hypothetical protein [Rhodococcus coprophilus]|uniref:hypothetical protein n=1 Tax=Rhodococcus coprophilus TaxID=38310 RepID=UPI0033EAEAEC
MNSSIADLVALCERLRLAKRELEVIRQEYGAYDDRNLDVDELGDQIEPDMALSSVYGGLLFTGNTHDSALRAKSRLRER